MTAICGGGTSSAQPGFAEALFVTPAAIAALLNNVPTLWAVPLAGYIGSITYHLSSFCATDPPAIPTFTPADGIALFNPFDPVAFTTAQEKFQALVGAYMWYQVCQCDSVATPAPPTPPAEPTGFPQVNPPSVAPSYPVGVPCQTLQFHDGPISGPPTKASPLYPLNGGTFGEILFSCNVVHTTSSQFGFDLSWYNASGTLLSGALFAGVATSGDFTHITGAAPTGATQFQLTWGPSGTVTPDITFDATVNIYCGSQPGGGGNGPIPQPCPADPYLSAQIDQILQLVKLMQRQLAPFAYIEGTAHTGLTGTGSIAVSRLLGARVDVTTIPAGHSTSGGNPTYVFDLGWVSVSDSNGMIQEKRLAQQHFTWLPPVAELAEHINYFLQPGVVITITELLPEP